jgi:hypothetical protein
VLNPVWLASDEHRNLTWPWFLWFLINPCANLLSVVLGVSHRTRTVTWARGEGWTYTDGWNWGWTVTLESKLRLPFVSYRGRYVEWSVGWKTSGAVGLTFRKARAKNTAPTP